MASGKSTIAKRIAEILSAEYVSIDKILEKNKLDKVSPKAECIPAENFIKSNETVFPGIREKLKKGKIIIFDGCFYHREVIENIIKNLKYTHYIFTLKASVEVCTKRDSKRKKSYGKISVMAVHKLVARFDYENVIDASKTKSEIVKEIISFLPRK